MHAHTTFSFLDGYGTAKQIAERVLELGHGSCAITDHGNVVGHVPFSKAMRSLNLNPVFGCEFYICDSMREKGRHCPSLGDSGKLPGPLPHITVLALDGVGYENLLALSTASYMEGYHHKPRIDHGELVKRQKGLAVLSGCPGGYPSRMINSGLGQRAWDLMVWLSNSIENYYVEVTPSPGYDVSMIVTDHLFEWAKALGRPTIMTADAHFPRPEDHEVEDLLLAVGLGKEVSDPTRELRLPDYQFYCGAGDMLARSLAVCSSTPLEDQIAAMNNAHALADSCRVEIPKGKMVAFPKTAGEDPRDMLRRLCWEGLREKVSRGEVTDWVSYWERAEHELEVIRSKGFSDYMLAVWDVVDFTKRRGGLVNLRGSAGGCMILWLLGCSNTDPIAHGLLFERFYDETRSDPPDVDIDFEKASRPIALAYMAETYGKDKVAQIAGMSQMKGRGALMNLCKGLGIPRSEYGKYSDAIEHEAAETAVLASIKGLVDARPDVGRLLPRVMMQVKTTTVHAAGVLVSSEPLEKCVGLMRGSEGQPVASVDKKGAEELGLLKFDFLCVQALDVVGTAARLVSESMNRPDFDWVYALSPDDPAVFATARAGMLAGVFQLDGAAAMKVAREISVDDFDDLVAASVLCRPGPVESVPIYRRHKQDPSQLAEYLSRFSPKAAAVVEPTNGVLMYQEQVMRLAREVAGLESAMVHRLRRDVGRKAGLDPRTGDQWRAEWRDRFVRGCVDTVGMPEAEAVHWWESVETHGGYSFNKSHGVSYGMVGYWMLWLKTYWPAQFYEAFLRHEADNDLLKKRLILEFKAMGGSVDMLDPIESRETFRAVNPSRLVGGFQDLRGIGPKTAERLVASSPYKDWDSLLDAVPAQVSSKIRESGFWSKDGCDPVAIAQLAPWLPIPGMPPSHRLALESRGASSCGVLGQEPIDRVRIGGYVTSRDFKPNRLAFSVEDTRGMATVRVSKRAMNGPLGAEVRALRPGDLVAVEGWWTGDTLFVSALSAIPRQ